MKKILHIFSKQNSVRGASLLLIATLTLSNVLGLFRDRFLTKNIATSELDIYYAAFRIPDLIFNILILGAISSAFIPIFSDYIANKKEKDGFKMTSSLMNLSAMIMIISAILLFALMPYLVPLVVPKFDGERLAQTIKFSRLLMLTPIFFSLSYIAGGVLNSFKRFLSYSLAPLFYNAAIIFGAAVLAPRYGLVAVIYCVIAGAILHFLIQIPTLVGLGFKYSFSFNYKDNSIKRIVRLMIPRTIGMGVNQFMLIAYTSIASSLAAGSIAAFELSNNIQTMPIVVFGTSFATAVFPTLTAKISENDKAGFAFYFDRAIRSLAFLLIPSTVLLFLLKAQVVRLILGSGKFSWDDTRITSMTLGFFALSLLAQGLIGLLARAFYALKDTRTPMWTSIVTAVLSIVIGYPLAKYGFSLSVLGNELVAVKGVPGLALAFSIASFVNAIALFVILAKKYPEIWNKEISRSFVKITIISIIMGIGTWFSMHILSFLVDMNRFMGILEQTILTLIVSGIIYFGLSYAANLPELKWSLSRKINGKH